MSVAHRAGHRGHPRVARAAGSTTEEIAGGLTNRNYRVDVDGQPCFVRIPGADTALLAVDRANELANSRAAAEAGVGPRVLEHLPAWDVMVLEWLPGRTLSNETCLEPGMPERIAERACASSTPARAFATTSTWSELAARYLARRRRARIRIPDGYRAHLSLVPRIEAALAARPVPTVPCHNDLLAANYLDDGERLWIVDYEYSGNATRPSSSATPARSWAGTTPGSKRSALPTSARRATCSWPACGCR